jgi:hypothetical protein
MDRAQVVSRIAAIAAKQTENQQDILMRLGIALPAFSSRLLDDLDLGRS